MARIPSNQHRRWMMFTLLAVLGYLVGYTIISFLLRPDPQEQSVQELPAPGLETKATVTP